jgi:hypothetical protein
MPIAPSPAPAPTSPNPSQGLKHQASAFPAQYCHAPTSPNPSQGLKRLTRAQAATRFPTAPTSPNPSQGLKRDRKEREGRNPKAPTSPNPSQGLCNYPHHVATSGLSALALSTPSVDPSISLLVLWVAEIVSGGDTLVACGGEFCGACPGLSTCATRFCKIEPPHPRPLLPKPKILTMRRMPGAAIFLMQFSELFIDNRAIASAPYTCFLGQIVLAATGQKHQSRH